MAATDVFVQHLEAASGLPALLAAGWESFDFIARSAPFYDDPDSGPRGFAFMLATGAACRGRNALACAPSLPDDAGTDQGLSVDSLGNETEAAATLAGLAAVLQSRLAAARVQALSHDDSQACEAAVAAAAETHTLLTGGSGS